ncbi:transcription initiation factor TFIIB Tfb1 [Natrinema pellirubrum DSM 15624]|uniref:Transcription initiation factor TFIIB Tfb1 n=1 Tax=Natrinema pellirubrum (strain DSM 15624 / CIP 106293 / JCM 10476 / NCIMB 786 / 157) TaxID=797303 RepID=L0JLE7_NATP1|nr:transcription initiation factor IIB family protein [Natrinema pellirubrum]AGB31673.1 transcription initiation factor TFIIIB, Brf1 subunit/transcription initiation factor TFIIB [Natrinema pellirubrum DSM 15624]ELY73041.1 transcription initiation factor TFIIB Tfb1 [Natrinema pellirubrum DSM 15624]
MTTESQDAVLRHLTSIQQTLQLDENIQQYGKLLVSELTARELQIRVPTRTAAACFLIACRLRKTPIRVTKIADASNVAESEILNEKKRISDALELGIPNDDPIVILKEACKDLALSADIQAHAQQIADLGAEAGVTSGVSPYTYAAAVLYVANSAADTDLSQADIADQFDVSTATLRDRRDDLLDAIGSQLFKLQYPAAPSEAVSLVDDLLHHAQTAHWAQGKRHMGVLAGAWLFAAKEYQTETSVSELAALTGVSESTIRARYEDFDRSHNGW